jgi:hypothetical protein
MCRVSSPRWLVFLCCVVSVCLSACAATAPVSPELATCMTHHDRFTRYDNGTVLDTCTHLMWMTQDYRNIEGKAPNSWPVAMAWAVTINQQCYGGYSDWRVPTLEEYKTVYMPEERKRSHNDKAVGYPGGFADGCGVWCWTREVSVYGVDGSLGAHAHEAYTFNFSNGRTLSRWANAHRFDRANEFTGSVRLVRGPLSTSMLPAAK